MLPPLRLKCFGAIIRQFLSDGGHVKIASTRVSYTGITSAFQADERGPTPLTRS